MSCERLVFLMIASQRAAKEAFVSGFGGTSVSENNLVVLCMPFAACAFAAATSATAGDRQGSRVATRLAEALILSLSQIGAVMGAASPAALASSAAGICAAVVLVRVAALILLDAPQRNAAMLSAAQRIGAPRASFISNYRGALMLSTCVVILAVDFQSFPRRFVKSHTYGTGLMDLGAGCFVAASGIVASRRGANSESPGLTRKFWIQLSGLVVLGCGRLAATRSVDYQLSVEEYGHHWNFFFTLAAVKALGALVPVPQQLALLTGLSLACGHQAALSWSGLGGVLHSSERGPGLLSRNKEGIMSLPGYWALYLLGLGAGGLLERTSSGLLTSVEKHGQQQKPAWQPVVRWVLLFTLSVSAIWVVFWVMGAYVDRVSRRACNLPYILWTMAVSLQGLLLFAVVDVVAGAHCALRLLEDFNNSLMVLFLLANLLTGAVNLSFDTLRAGQAQSRCILLTYTLILFAAARLLASHNWQLAIQNLYVQRR